MNFSPQQEHALELINDWLQGDKQVFRLFGYAGTGKTTLAKYMDANHYAAFTGKAAYVLKTKGCPATTIHSLIYTPQDKSAGRLKELIADLEGLKEWRNSNDSEIIELEARIQEERDNLKRPNFTLNLDSPLRSSRLLVIDECSMVDKAMAEDLLSFGCRILVLGDPAQLPPVKGCGYFTDAEPDYLLTEIHRQARGNPILDLATTIRETGKMPSQHSCMISTITPEMAMEVDQIICGKNVTRHGLNARMRDLLGFQGLFPQVGEKVVCLRNNHDIGILNGATYEVTGVDDEILELDKDLVVPVHPQPFRGEEVDWWDMRNAELFDYGYALTGHKAQGSQWGSVGVVNESYVFKQHRARWLYTAVTRAAETLWVT